MSVLSPNEYVVGASAAVYGLLFSHLSTIILNWDQMDRKRCRLFCLVLYIVFNFLLEFMTDAHVRPNTLLINEIFLLYICYHSEQPRRSFGRRNNWIFSFDLCVEKL